MTLPIRHRAERSSRKHGLLISLLGLLILVEAFTVFVVLASQQFAADQALREHTHELLQNVVDETRENAVGYLRQAQDSVSLASSLFEAGLLSCRNPKKLERYFLEQLRVIPQIDGLYFGDTEGNFVFSKRHNAQSLGGFLSKIVQNSKPDESRVELINRDAQLNQLDRQFDVDDTYDPRKRPWFERATVADGEVWTDPYIFYTSQRPGLTVARAVYNRDGELTGVMGADIELSALSDFLTAQRIGKSGAAFIVYSNGSVLAHPNAADLAQRDNGSNLRLKRLHEMDEITARAGSRLKQRFPDLIALNYTHYDTFNIGDKRYVSMFVPLLAHGQNQWVMGVYAPEDELAKTIRDGQRESIYLGIAMSLLTITAAIAIGLFVLRPIYTLQRQAREDPLTGLMNRRSFDETAGRRMTNAVRDGHAFTAIMIDIDRFKPINDEHGHAVGDEVLLIVSRRISRALSDDDLLSRYGGEEFAVVLPNTDLEAGVQVAERLREFVGSEPIKTTVGPLDVTISLGVAQAGSTTRSIADLLDRADQGLLTAKRQGRNCVIAMPG
ncbi:diguanylate cyclase [Thiosocius teredinicola]|uniref:diguanylate cyclase n=1 Tax=Thiosocius teredinicola TaxID=1973002 RepID=UPI000990F41D